MIIYLFILCAEYSLLLWTLQLSLLSLLSIAVICAAMLNVWIGLELVWSWPKSSLSWQTQLFFRSSVFRPIDCKSTLGFSPQGGVRTPQSFNITPDSYRYWWSDHVFQYLSLLLRDSSWSELQYSVEGKKKKSQFVFQERPYLKSLYSWFIIDDLRCMDTFICLHLD